MRDPRSYLEGRVEERLAHASAEAVQMTCSFARAERLLGREYHGRFLIELLQNAADAWRKVRQGAERSPVRVVLEGQGPALVVANRGEVFRPEVVIESLGHIGHSTKAQGEAIGHKGIGFKSVLELCLSPQLFSGLQQPSIELAVGFHPEKALERIRGASKDWDLYIREVGDVADDLAAIPVLRYPEWEDELPAVIRELKDEGFDTAIRLPFDADLAARLGLTEAAWLTTVRDAFNDVTDQMLLLLGTFDEVTLENRLDSTTLAVTPRPGSTARLAGPIDREDVEVLRNQQLSSSWRLYRRSMPDAEDLAGEIAVGLRLDGDRSCAEVQPAVGDEASSPFHLFFPTKIGSGLPFLLHGYFEVDAARTGFYAGSHVRNDAILEALSALVATAVADAAGRADVDLASLVHLLAVAPQPEDGRARRFREDTLGRLDSLAWVPLAGGGHGAPRDLLVDANAELLRAALRVFPAEHVQRVTGLLAPADNLTNEAHQFLAGRAGDDCDHGRDLWTRLPQLLRPDGVALWPEGQEDDGFRALMDLVAALDATDRGRTTKLLDELRGDGRSTLLPAVAAGGGRTLLPLPEPSEGVAGRRSTLVMARVRSAGGESLHPPALLELAFLPDSLLDSEAQLDRARPLGVRPFTVDNVLDRVGGADSPTEADELVRFLWALLAREGKSEFGTRSGLRLLEHLDPSAWFWCQPGRGDGSDTDRDRQRRERNLAQVPLPARDGTRRAGGTLAFGSDWADFIESGRCGPVADSDARTSAYRSLEAVKPDEGFMLAAPEIVLELLSDSVYATESRPEVGQAGSEEPAELAESERNLERLAFLLRLGVWETVPVEAFDSRTPAGREPFPWDGPLHDQRVEEATGTHGWTFDRHRWSGQQHHNVYAAEDFRFQWPLDDVARQDPISLARALTVGTTLYRHLAHLAVFCPRCNDSNTGHVAPYRSRPEDGYASLLTMSLRRLPWVPAVRDGQPLEEPLIAEEAWWSPRTVSGAGLQQSPLRFLPLCHPDAELSTGLREHARINDFDHAGVSAVHRLLTQLRDEFESGRLPADPLTSGSARQAFVGLHRLAYERLAELVGDQAAETAAVLVDVGVLSDLGDGIDYRPPAEVRHDDGTFAAYRRHFAGRIAFSVLPRDRASVAKALGIPPFVVSLTRRDHQDEGLDVTAEIHDALADRIPELLAIVVHHSLGAQTLDPTSTQFEDRSRRLRNVTVRQVRDLVLDAHVEGTKETEILGEGPDQDLFPEGPTTSAPVLYHDLDGDGWQDRLRRKLASPLASLVENPAYAATFALFLLAETETERAGVLQDLGITTEEVDAIRTRIGAVSQEDRRRHQLWFGAVLAAVRHEPEVAAVDSDSVYDALVAAGLDSADAHALVDLGGGDAVRTDPSPDGALSLLRRRGVDLGELHQLLRAASDAGLDIRIARENLRRWTGRHGTRAAVVLAHRMPAEAAKAAATSWSVPERLRFSLDPALRDLLDPVVASLQRAGFAADPDRLAASPEDELLRLSGLASLADLDDAARLLYDAEEQTAALRSLAGSWRRHFAGLAGSFRSTDSAQASSTSLTSRSSAPTTADRPVTEPRSRVRNDRPRRPQVMVRLAPRTATLGEQPGTRHDRGEASRPILSSACRRPHALAAGGLGGRQRGRAGTRLRLAQ